VNTAGFHGTVTRTITISSNDPANPSVVLRIDTTIADVPVIPLAELKTYLLLLVDVRTADEYATGHLFGAVNIPLFDIVAQPALWASRLPHDVPIVLYGADSEGGRTAGGLLITAGLSNVFNLEGGLAGWDAAFGAGVLYAP